jgi:DNA-binding MarR family transcriptional regulator
MAVKPNNRTPARGGVDAPADRGVDAPSGEDVPNNRTPARGGVDAPADRGVDAPSGEDVDAALQELVLHIRPVVMALKQGGPPPPELQEAFATCDLGPRHGVVLLNLTLSGQLSVSELAERLALSLSTTSLMVGQLSRAGLLERVEDERDRRRTLVRLNETYREQIGAWLIERIGPLRRTLERLSPAQRAGFLEGWRILEEETAGLGGAADAASADE